jgi:hypothetical protein
MAGLPQRRVEGRIDGERRVVAKARALNLQVLTVLRLSTARRFAFRCRVDSSSVGVLNGTGCLVHHTYGLGAGVAGNPANAFLHLAAEISDGATNTIISH